MRVAWHHAIRQLAHRNITPHTKEGAKNGVRWTWAPRFRLSPPPSRKPKSWSATGAARAPRLAPLPLRPPSRASSLVACCVSQSRGVGAEHFTTAAVPPTPARTRTATRRPPRRVRGRSRTPRTWPTARAAHPPPLLLQLQLEPGRQWEQGQAPGPQQWRPCAVAGKAPAVRQEGGRRERDVPGVQPEHDRPHGVRADQVDLRPAQGWLGPAMAPQPLPRARARASG